MKESRVTLRYAKAILDLATDKSSELAVNDSMHLIINTITDNPDLDLMLKSPVIKSSKKVTVLDAIFKDTDEITKGLFNVLQENKRLNLLALVCSKYIILFKERQNIKEALVTTVVPLTKELEDKIQAKIVSLIGSKVAIKNIIDESIIGGFILKVGDKQFDASLANKFSNLQRTFDNRNYQAKN